jgi:hypothetical protein
VPWTDGRGWTCWSWLLVPSVGEEYDVYQVLEAIREEEGFVIFVHVGWKGFDRGTNVSL